MIATFVPNERARRIVIALLAFILAAAFAVAASIAPAEAAQTTRDFSAAVAAGNPVESGQAGTYTVTFTNLGPTDTQRAGSFLVDFDAHGFAITGVDKPVTTDEFGAPTNLDWVVTSGLDSKVVISAFDGGERILVDDKVSVDVHVTAPPWIPPDDPNHYFLDVAADQEDHGDFKGGNKFTRVGPKPDAQVAFGGEKKDCDTEELLDHCTTGSEPAANGSSATSECGIVTITGIDGEDCFKFGILTVEAEATFCDNNDCEASWIANSTTGGFFYVIITVAPEDQGGNHKILYDLDPADSNDGLTVAKNCKPPVRTFNCVDTDHPDFERGKTYPLKFESTDPRGSYR